MDPDRTLPLKNEPKSGKKRTVLLEFPDSGIKTPASPSGKGLSFTQPAG
jgi:hypothetical protein